MPFYDYKCKTCDHVETVRRSMVGDFTPPECPNDGDDMQRLFSPPAGIIIQ